VSAGEIVRGAFSGRTRLVVPIGRRDRGPPLDGSCPRIRPPDDGPATRRLLHVRVRIVALTGAALLRSDPRAREHEEKERGGRSSNPGATSSLEGRKGSVLDSSARTSRVHVPFPSLCFRLCSRSCPRSLPLSPSLPPILSLPLYLILSLSLSVVALALRIQRAARDAEDLRRALLVSLRMLEHAKDVDLLELFEAHRLPVGRAARAPFGKREIL